MDDEGTLVPSSKLTAMAVAVAVAGAAGRWLEQRFGWMPPPVLVDLVALALAAAIGYLVPELNPAPSTVRALRRRT
jgi:predicted MFS family arabinose efflux permease